MLLEFKVKNYKSFKEEMVFNMRPTPKMQDLNYSILKQKIGSKDVKALSSSIIYGFNAAGKSTVINAMSFFQRMILKGNITDEEEGVYIDPFEIKFLPNINAAEGSPMEFSISFTHSGLLFDYYVSFYAGRFAAENSERYVKAEKLSVNNKEVFIRNMQSIKVLQNKNFVREFDAEMEPKINYLAEENLSKTELFLTSTFEAYYGKKIVLIMKSWLKNYFYVTNDANRLFSTPKYNGKKAIVMDQRISSIANRIGILGDEVIYGVTGDQKEYKLMTVLTKEKQEDGKLSLGCIDSKLIESVGTVRFLELAPIFLEALARGRTLVMDEMDASIHPALIMNIVNIFHNDDINKKGAQLIFTSHNASFLETNIFRRDEIKFVQRDYDKHTAEFYSLADFGANGNIPARSSTNFLKNYFKSKYGGIEMIDLSDMFKDLKEEEYHEVATED